MQGTITVNFVIRLKRRDPRVLLERSLFLFCSHFKHNFFKPTLFSLGYDYYASARMVASQLNHQIILLLKRPLTHYWTSPLKVGIPLDWGANLSFLSYIFYPTENQYLVLEELGPFSMLVLPSHTWKTCDYETPIKTNERDRQHSRRVNQDARHITVVTQRAWLPKLMRLIFVMSLS